MTQFEYLIEEKIKAIDYNELNIIGKVGWELISIIHYDVRGIHGIEHNYKYYFKRPYEKKEQCQECEKTQEEAPQTEIK